MATFINNIVWGVPKEIKPILNAPPGRQRLRFRQKSEAHLFVKSPEGLRRFILRKVGDHWEPGTEIAWNYRPDPPPF